MRCFLFVVLIAGCLDAAKPYEPSITQGVYGKLSSTSDVQGVPDSDFTNAAIAAYRAADTMQIAADTSDGTGMYELALGPGSYIVCTLGASPSTLADQYQHNCAGKCTRLDVGAGTVRADWAANLSGGWWEAGEHCSH